MTKYFGAYQEMNAPYANVHVGTVVLWPFERLCFQEIHSLKSKKTDMGELQKEREEVMQRLRVSFPLADGWYHRSAEWFRNSVWFCVPRSRDVLTP